MQKSDKSDRTIGYTVFILECADGSYFAGMCRNLRKKLWDISSGKGIYFSKHPERLPVKAVFKEEKLFFKEAYEKSQYLKTMNREMRKKLIDTKTWPVRKKKKKKKDLKINL